MRTPAAAPTAAATPKLITRTITALIPQIPAAVMSSKQARIARPYLLLFRKRCRTKAMQAPTAITITLWLDITPPGSSMLFTGINSPTVTVSLPHMCMAKSLSSMEAAIVTVIRLISLFTLTRLINTLSKSKPTIRAVTTARGKATIKGNPSTAKSV